MPIPIGGIVVGAWNVNTIDKGFTNIGPLMVTDWNGYSHQNYGQGENNGNANVQLTGTSLVFDPDGLDQPVSKASAV